MTDTTFRPDEEDDLLAAEYVSGLLDLEERTAVEIRLRNDAGFAARVTDWENRLADLNDDYDAAPAPNLLPQIEARLFPSAPAATLRSRFWSNLWAWGATTATAIAVVLYLLLTPAAPSFTATLVADAGALRFEAVITQDQLTITRVAGDAAPSDRTHELWIIAGDNPPVSLGLMTGNSLTLPLPSAAAGVILAVSEEQAGGSPDGTPHGPIVALGKLQDA